MTKSTTQKKKQPTENLDSSRTARIFMALYIVLSLLLQLFTFDKFPDLLAKLGVSSGWAVLLIILELLSLPFLLDMKLPVVYRKISMWIGVATLVLLTALETMAYENNISVMFGATFDLPGGSWSILLIVAMWILFAWGAWGSISKTWLNLVSPKNKTHTKPKTKK